ncbi:MAG: hypothetical protein KIT72_08825 [Polyangiaceae bacterium]|nr:hypothetical protein [Polyangiaceae bacterium]MCW5790512.1 hypothetical protein [Polyangiaceae bacterium]
MRLRRASIIGGGFTLACALAVACSGADDTPQSNIGTGGAAGSGGTAGTGGDGGSLFDAAFPDVIEPNDPKCTDETDSDGDGIADMIEGDGDTDGDGIPDKLDLDSDNDGIPDAEEAANPSLRPGAKGRIRTGPCSPVANSDDDLDGPDFQDLDSDNDGVPDEDEVKGCAVDCRVNADCDSDTIVDIVEMAAGSDPCDASSQPTNASLYFIVPYGEGPKTQRFPFSTGIKDADVYFMIDTTRSMQPAIDNVKSSLDTTIIPTILNGSTTAVPPIPAIPGAYLGIGSFKDVPWLPYGNSGDQPYTNRFCVGGSLDDGCAAGSWVDGNLTEPINTGGVFTAPTNVRTILDDLTASGGEDAPEALTQALFMAVNSSPFAFTGGPPAQNGGIWSPHAANCEPGLLGRACLRPGKLPIFVVITDAPSHNGPTATYNYDPSQAGGSKSYAEVVAAMNAVGAKIVGVPVQTAGGGSAAPARTELVDLAQKTGSLYYDPTFGGRELPLVNDPTANGRVAEEVVRLIGLLAGQGLNNVTTRTTSYDCPGNTDCDGDGIPDPEYHNRIDTETGLPFDATRLIQSVTPVPSTQTPLPYATLDATTFYSVRGDQTVEFEVTARNDTLKPGALTVLRALLRVQTPGGKELGGRDGIKVIYLVVPRYVDVLR